ncbi:MAG TPA: hypothetical protein VGE74_14205, partial [Gemmata sp.]
MRRTLYWKRLLIVATSLLVLAGAVFAVHRVQIKSQVTVYKEAAERAEAEINGDAARRGEVLDLYAKYLKFRPTDEAAYQKYAALLFEQAKAESAPGGAERATAGIEGFLRAFPAHPAERHQLAELYTKSGRYMNARQHVEMLLASPVGDPKSDPELLELAAKCDQGMGDLAKAVEHLNAAIKTGKAPVRVYKRALELNFVNKADAQRNTNISALLEGLLREPRFVNDLTARVAAGRFQLFLKEVQNADDNISYARNNIPGGADDPDTLLASAEIELAKARNAEKPNEPVTKAREYLQRARNRDPKNIAVGALLCEVMTRQGDGDKGLEVLRATAKLLDAKDPDYVMVTDRLIDLGEQTDSAAMVDAIATDESRKVVVPYLRGRIAVLKQDWNTALRLLEEARPNITRVPMFHKKALVGLAACYAIRQNPDKQLEFCHKALEVDPEYPPALVGEAEALAKMPRIGEALNRYRLIVNRYQLSEYRAELVRLELYEALGQPGGADGRNWGRFEEAVGKGPVAERSAEVQVLCADALVSQGKGARAAQEMREWLDKNPKSPKAGTVFVALARLNTGGTVESALAVLDEARAKVGDSADLRLARAGLLVARGRVPEPAEFDALAAGAGAFPKPDQFKLWLGLGQAAGRVADLQTDGTPARALRGAAIRYLRAAADLQPKDLTSRAALLDHGIASGDKAVVKQALEEIAKVEGGDGPVGTLGRIAIDLPEVRKMTDGAQRAAAVQKLRELGRTVRESRPGWGRVYVALAELDMIEGLNEAALDNYKRAIDNGERQEFVIRRTVDLFRIKKQDDLAVGLLNRLRSEVRLPDDLERYRAIRDLLSAPEVPRNSRLTVDGIAPADSKDYRLLLLRGSLLATIRDPENPKRGPEDALEAFTKALDLNDKTPETWASLVAQLIRMGKTDDAKRAVGQGATKLKKSLPATPEARAELTVAVGGLYEMVGDLKTALGYYEGAVAEAPLDLNPTRQLVLFYQRSNQAEKADQLLNAAKGSPAPDIARWARRHLALTMISRANAYTVRAEALALIQRNLEVSANDPEDVKAQAVIWTVDPVTREEGIRVLSAFGARGDLTPDEFYLLGRLAFDVGRFPAALDYFQKGARIRPGVTAEHIAALVRVNVAQEQFGAAAAALDRLKINNPGSWEAVREEARLLHRKSTKVGDPEAREAKELLGAARALIKTFPGWDSPDVIVSRTGPLFEEIGLPDEAEALYKKFLAASTDPGAHQPLAILYIRQKEAQKAIDLALAREPKAPVLLTARLLTGAVRAKRPDLTVEAKIEAWLDAALTKSATDPELGAALIGAKAELADARGDYKTAIKEYERSVAAFDKIRDPRGRKDVVVNNLCMLLALTQPDRASDAVKMMSDLIAIRGPVPPFLDTRAVAYLVSSRPELAISDLKMALIQYDRATYHFHMAWA